MSQVPPGSGKREAVTLSRPCLSEATPKSDGKARPPAPAVPNFNPFHCEASQEGQGVTGTGDLLWMAVELRLSGHVATWPLALGVGVMVKALWADHRSPQKIAEGYQAALVLTTGAWELNLQEWTSWGWVALGRGRSGQRY